MGLNNLNFSNVRQGKYQNSCYITPLEWGVTILSTPFSLGIDYSGGDTSTIVIMLIIWNFGKKGRRKFGNTMLPPPINIFLNFEKKFNTMGDALPTFLIDSNVSPRWTQQKNEEFGYTPWLVTLRG
jgi:hypothetical protein